MDLFEPTIEYRPIPGFPGYRIGSDGSVWTCRPYPLSKDRSPRPWRRMATPLDRRGYRKVQISQMTTKKRYNSYVHRLLLEAFVGPCPPGMLGLHKNDIHDDNRLENLYWGTYTDNLRDAYANQRIPMGLDHWRGKLSEEDVRIIRQRIADGERASIVAKTFHIGTTYAREIASGKERRYVPFEDVPSHPGKIKRATPHPNARLTPMQVQNIIDAYATGTTSFKKLGKAHGIAPTHAWNIVRGKAWKELPFMRVDDVSQSEEDTP